MSKLAQFFQEPHSALGVFYPLHCLVAAFPTMEAAERVRGSLGAVGFSDDDVIAIDGKQLLGLETEETGLGSLLMREFSRDLGSEQISTDHNLDFARRGAAFVVVHCPGERLTKKAWDVVREAEPLTAHYYTRLSIYHLACSLPTQHA